eukprot:scaffold27171_cov128-Skeletonema_dohrnii-CCMP3373.AAC.1
MHLYNPANRSIDDSILCYELAACFLVTVAVTAHLFQIYADLFCHYIGTTNLMGGENNNVNSEAVEWSFILSSMRTIQPLETNNNIIGGT